MPVRWCSAPRHIKRDKGTNKMTLAQNSKIAAVIVTYQRFDLFSCSLQAVMNQSRLPDWIIVIDNGDEPAIQEVAQKIAGSLLVYIPAKRNLGGAGGYALGFLTALTLGADAVWCADDDGQPHDNYVLQELLECAVKNQLDQVSPAVCSLQSPQKLAFPVRRGLEWKTTLSELRGEADNTGLLTGISALFNGALISSTAIETVGLPSIQLFIRGDEVDFHRRLVRSGLKFGTNTDAVYLHPDSESEHHSIFGGKAHVQVPVGSTKQYYQFRNRGFLLSQPGKKKLKLQEYVRYFWFYIIVKKDPKSFILWHSLMRQGAREQFLRIP